MVIVAGGTHGKRGQRWGPTSGHLGWIGHNLPIHISSPSIFVSDVYMGSLAISLGFSVEHLLLLLVIRGLNLLCGKPFLHVLVFAAWQKKTKHAPD